MCTLTLSATASHAVASSSTTCRYTTYGCPPPPYSCAAAYEQQGRFPP